MMKKTIVIILSLFLVTLLFAEEQRVFEKLTKQNYKNVKIESITWKGIRIRYSDGNRERAKYITDKDLSAAERKLLAKELEILRRKVEKHNKRVGVRNQFKEKQENELAELMKRLPKMSSKDINNWFHDRIGSNPYRKDFKEKFFKTYEYAKNSRNAMKACEVRLFAIDKPLFDKMKSECLATSSAAANSILKRRVGAAFNHPSFHDCLRTRFVWIPVRERKAFIDAMNKKIADEKVCCFCKKEPSITPGSYGKACGEKVCTKCKKKLVDSKDPNNKEKICESCKEESVDEDGGAAGAGDNPY